MEFSTMIPCEVDYTDKYVAWLLHGPLPPNIHSFTLGSLKLDLRTLGRICRNQVQRGNQPILAIRARNILRFDFEQLSAFGDLAGDRLEILQLFQEGRLGNRKPIAASDLRRLVGTVKEQFPALLELDIAITGPIERDYSIELANRSYDGKLRRIHVKLQPSVFEEGWGCEPIIMLARSFACLGRPDCRYDCTAWAEGVGFRSLHGYDDAFGKLVRYFQGQPPHISRHLRAVDFASIGIQQNGVTEVHDLAFTSSGRPIPSAIRKGRQAHRETLREFCLYDRMLHPTCQIIAKELADAADRGDEWIDPRLFVGLIYIGKDRRSLAAKVSKIRNAIIQDGWSIEDEGDGP